MVEPLSQEELDRRNADKQQEQASTDTETATTQNETRASIQNNEPQVIDLTDTSNVPVMNLVDAWKVEHARKCEVFNKWCFDNGVKMPKVDYPGYFEGGLVGMKANAPIQHRESFLAIPYKMLMTVERAQNHEILGPIIRENPQLFDEEHKGDWEQLTLALYLIYENQKGDESFWKPYIDLMPDVKFFCHWPEELFIETQDHNLMQYATEYK